IIDQVKFYFQCHKVFSDLFPSMQHSVDGICQDILNDAIACFMEMDCIIEDRYWGKYKDSMAICVGKDINTFHSEICKVIIDLVPINYGLSAAHVKTLADHLAMIKGKASVLAHKFSFLQRPLRNLTNWRSTSNFSHNCLRVACHHIFYQKGSKSFCNHEVFKETVPFMAILYVASYIKGALDLYAASGTMQGKVSPAKNEEDFWKMHGKMQEVLDHEYYGLKLTVMLEAWAHEA
ncbi:hypothetical protein V8E55_009520, partial [Tylopilus felleus]